MLMLHMCVWIILINILYVCQPLWSTVHPLDKTRPLLTVALLSFDCTSRCLTNSMRSGILCCQRRYYWLSMIRILLFKERRIGIYVHYISLFYSLHKTLNNFHRFSTRCLWKKKYLKDRSLYRCRSFNSVIFIEFIWNVYGRILW